MARSAETSIGMFEHELSQNRGAPNYPNQESGIGRWQLDPEDVLRWMEHKLRGHHWDITRRQWTSEGSVPLCSEEGIETFLSIVGAYTNRIFLLSNFDDRDINRMASENRNSVIGIIAMRAQEFGIHKANRDRILNLCDHTVYAILRSAWKAGMRTGIQTAQRVVETHTQTNTQPRSRLLPRLFGRQGRAEE